jgi:hypothetical protein
MPVYPTASGHPDYSSTGTSKFIPQIWSGKMVVKFYISTVFGEIANTDYEGEITKYGDKVLIRTVPDIVINDYVKGQDLDYENPESPNVELNIDKGKYFAFACDDVDKKQADIPFIDKWSDDAAQQMKIKIDNTILNDSTNVITPVDADNKGQTAGKNSSSFDMGVTGAAIPLSKTNVLDYIVDAGSVLTEQNIPETQRWIVLPTWATNLLKKSDLKDASMTGDNQSTLRNGRLGMIDNFTIYQSNNYDAITDGGASCYNILYGHISGLTFAAQMTKMETLRNPKTFGDLIRGLNVFGYEVIKGTSIGILYARKA